MATRRLIRPTLDNAAPDAAPGETQEHPQPQPPEPPARNDSRASLREPRFTERERRPSDRQPYQKHMRPPQQQGGGRGGDQGQHGRHQQQRGRNGGGPSQHQQHRQHGGGGGGGQHRRPQSLDVTHAESFYYLKQMKNRTPMVIVMHDGEILKGIIEWYDHDCVKLSREDNPNIILFKRYIRWMHKDPDAAENMDQPGDGAPAEGSN